MRTISSGPSSFIPDRGPAKYFHGRERILGNFNTLAKESVQVKGGTIFLIQGAPGAGKTALLDQCAKLAKGVGWKIAMLRPTALMDPEELLDRLGKGGGMSITGGSGQVGVDAMIKAQGTLDFAFQHPARTMEKILQDGKKPLLLILDEAQSLGLKDVVPADQKRTVTSILDYIHNGGAKRPLILLTAGLGRTKTAFGSLGISRFKGGCFVELGALGKEAERAVIRDWLKKRGRAKGDPTGWMDAIAQKTHGWPQHILSYVYPASEHLKANDGIMTPEGLHAVLEAGREGRTAYYDERSYGFPEEERQGLAKAFADTSLGKSMTRQAILSSLAQDFEPDEAKNIFNRAWNKGLLDERSGRYVIPIPSMQDWLLSNYTREKIEFPHSEQVRKNVRQRNSGMDLEGR